ncbi:MAG: ABC transporter permease subunit [Pseudomonadota bacterium]
MGRTLKRGGWVIFAAVLWEVLARVSGDSVLISSPLAILTHMAEHQQVLMRAAYETTINAAFGFLWGNLAAIVLAGCVIAAPVSDRFVSTVALLVFSVPLIATGPILRVLYGTGVGPQVTLAALAVYYTTFLSLVVGLRAVPRAWTDLIAIYGRGPLTTLARVRARASLPYLFAGLQIAAPAAFLGAMIGEFTGAERGLGVLTLRAMRGLDTDATWALATISATIAIVGYGAVGWLGRRTVGYAPVILLSPPRTRAKPTARRRVFDVASVTLAILVVWQVSMDIAGLNRFFAKRPGDILIFLMEASNRETLFLAMTETLTFVLPGYLAGLLLGAGLAAAFTLAPKLAAAVMPVAVALRSVPIITTAPLLLLAFGRGASGTIVVVAVMIFFPTLVACLHGLRQTPGQIAELFASYGAGRWRLLISAQIPAMLPAFFAAARMAVPAALLAVTTAEWLATGKGIGVLMALTASTSNYNMLWSCVVLLCVTSALAYALVAWCERAVLSRYASEQVT